MNVSVVKLTRVLTKVFLRPSTVMISKVTVETAVQGLR